MTDRVRQIWRFSMENESDDSNRGRPGPPLTLARTIFKILLGASTALLVMAVIGVGVWHWRDLESLSSEDSRAEDMRAAAAAAEEALAQQNKYFPKNTAFDMLDCEAAFESLSSREKRYAHYLSRAAWDGMFIVFFQSSRESPLILTFLDKVLRMKPNISAVKTHLKDAHAFTDDDVTAFFVYVGVFLSNGGNFRGFGDLKFLPEVPQAKMESLLRSVIEKEDIDFYIKHCLRPMYDFRKSVRTINFPPLGVTTYWSSNCNVTDVDVVAAYLREKKLDAYNQRVFKTVQENGQTSYEIRFASQQLSDEPDTTHEQLLNLDEVMNNTQFRVRRGDYSTLFPNVIKNLKLGSIEAANDHERQMLNDYITYFKTGSLYAHKQASLEWIKDKEPVVESYFGFVESYRDPSGSRAEFEGFVAVVNREGSKKLAVLVTKAEKIVNSLMPWPKEYEKDSYLSPDFTSLDVITFSASGVPAGINIPNYDDMRQKVGFKNLNLQNVFVAHQASSSELFISENDQVLINKYRELAFEVQVGLHELLGHGSGKLFEETADNQFNFDTKTLDPISGKPVSSYYRPGQTYNLLFKTLGPTYEECRAEAVGLYLSLNAEVLEVFNCTEKQEQDDVVYVNFLSVVLSGLYGLQLYNSETKKWGQAHTQARFVILNVLLESAPNLVLIREILNAEDHQPDLLVSLNRNEIRTSGKEALQNFLLKLQVYKSTANVAAAKEMYAAYSDIKPDSMFHRWRNIVVTRQKPRAVLIQGNTRLNKRTNEVQLLTYPSTPEGYAESWIDRYVDMKSVYGLIRSLYEKDMEYFPLDDDYQ